MSKNQTIRDYALRQVGGPYVYGATGRMCTPAMRQQQIKQYPDFSSQITRYCPVLSGAQVACRGCKHDGRLAFDCAQLTRRAAEAAGLSLPSGSKSQFTRGDWIAGGDINSLPPTQVAFLYRQAADGSVPHTGIYLGDGSFVDARGHQQGGMHGLLGTYRWTHWRVLRGQEPVNGGGGGLPSVPPPQPTDEVSRVRDLQVIKGQPLLRGADVLTAQSQLVRLGFSVGAKGPDGVYGWDTDRAVKDFQRAHGLAMTGIWGQAERAKANEALAAPPSTPPQQPGIDRPALWAELDALRARETAILTALRGEG